MDNSSGIPSFKRAKTMRGKRHLQQRGALTIENPKKILYLRGTKCPQLVCDIFQDLHKMTKPQSRNFSRKRDLRPMEDEAELERLSSVQDVSLFAVGTSNKKRPSAITFARMFDHHLLDMCEFQVTDYKAMADFKDVLKPGLGNKPIVLFHGHGWDHSTDFRNAKSMLMDIFRGPVAKKLFLGGIDRVVVFTAEEPQIRMQQFLVTFKKSGTRLPIVKLTECGPYLGLKMGRTRWAADGLMKQALRIPDDLKAKKKKNIARNEMGETMGRVHMQRQDFNQMQTRKMKGLKRRTAAKAPGGNDNDEE